MHARPLSPPPEAPSPPRQPTRPIRALSRGLEVLAELNRRERAPIHTLSSAVRLPRTTTFRILETLRLAGFVQRDAHDDCYRPTVLVRSLADGFDDEARVAHIGKAHLPVLARQIVWPMDIATPAQSAMVVREALLESLVLDPLVPRSVADERLARDRPEIERILQETRAQGFALSQRPRRISQEISLALPLRAADRVLGTLGVRFAATAVPLRSAVEQFLPKMREIVRKIETEFALEGRVQPR